MSVLNFWRISSEMTNRKPCTRSLWVSFSEIETVCAECVWVMISMRSVRSVR